VKSIGFSKINDITIFLLPFSTHPSRPSAYPSGCHQKLQAEEEARAARRTAWGLGWEST